MANVRTDILTREEREDRAQRRITRFVARFEPAYYELLCHAALSLVLTPELVSYLRNEFLREIPWIAEVDLLLSDLCSPVGYELYAMDTDVRAYLLKQRSDTFNETRMAEVANLLISYVRYLAANNLQVSDRELESQQWAAMIYLGPVKQREMVDQIVERFQACIAGGEQLGTALVSQAEMAQLAQFTQTFSAELSEYPELIDWASLVSDVQLRNVLLEEARVEKAYEVTPGQLLQLTSEMKRGLRNRIERVDTRLDGKTSLPEVDNEPPIVRPSDVQPAQILFDAFPPLETLEFIKGELIDNGIDEDGEPSDAFPPLLKTANFKIATISLPQQALEIFEFETAKIERGRGRGVPGIGRNFLSGFFEGQGRWTVKKSRAQARRFVEPLSDDLTLEMVAISGGQFLMGSPDSEQEREPNEGPQHQVTVPDFFMGRYLVTQAQWWFVASLPQVNRELKPNPSEFQGSRLPVERISWYEATEFCDRLSAHTKRAYCLPSEAEWEYACRAGTTTPFHFGDMILSEVANYDGNYAYADGPKGETRQKTTSVDEFNLANGFGLSDMHGNVFEWCQDHWHGDYKGAPTDGGAWLTNDEEVRRIRRGGSWYNIPRICRSACRYYVMPDDRFNNFGFRVSCSAPRT
jgi:formylglycine-generating enzyme required for sulfatase activity